MVFIRKIKTKSGTYLAEVENKWIKGKVVQKHIRYIGKAPSRKKISVDIDNINVKKVKSFADLLIIDEIAADLNLHGHLGPYSKELLALIYSHIIDSQSISKMEEWFERTDLNKILKLKNISEKTLHLALDSISNTQSKEKITHQIRKKLLDKNSNEILIYDLTDTYFTGNKYDFRTKKRGKDGKYASLVQLGLVVDKKNGFPLTYKMYDGNISDKKTVDDILMDINNFKCKSICLVLDRGFFSIKNIDAISNVDHQLIMGVPANSKLKALARKEKDKIISLNNRVKLNKTTFYVKKTVHTFGNTQGHLHIVFNNKKEVKAKEELFDKIEETICDINKGMEIPDKMMKFFNKDNSVDEAYLEEYLTTIGFTYIFSTNDLAPKELIKTYFDKDIVEKSFRSLKGVLKLRPIKFWLKKKVEAHLLICYISYAILSLLKSKLKTIGMTPEYALNKLKTAYKVEIKETKQNVDFEKVVVLSREQEKILKQLDVTVN